MVRSIFCSALCSSVFAFAASTTPAAAQDKGTSAEDATDGAIIVTARRTEERLQDVPISITVFNQQQLTDRNIVSAADLATYTPSLSVNTNFGGANTVFALRGFSQEYATQPSVGVYFNDVVAPRGAANNLPVGDGAGPGSFFDLQNVQVLKGPQGTLFGRNTTGGAVLLVPQKPTSKLEGYVEGSYGNYDMKRIQGVLNIPLGDSARFRVGVDHESRDGYLKSDSTRGPSDFDDINYTAARASLIVDLTPDLETYTVASFLRSDTNGSIQKVIACNPRTLLGPAACAQLAREQAKGADFYTVENPMDDPRTLQTQWQVINTTTWRASDTLTLKNIISYAQLEEKLRDPFYGSDLELGGLTLPPFPTFAPGTTVDFAQSNPLPGHATANQSTFTEEFRLQGNALGNRLTYQTGVYLESSSPLGLSGSFSDTLLQCSGSNALNCTNPLGFGSVSYTANRTQYHDIGIYAQGTYSLTDQLKITGGFRYTWDRAHSDAVLASYAIPTPGVGVETRCNEPTATFPACDVHYSQRSSAPTWLIDLDYKPTNALLLYAKYARGYRAGGVAPQAPRAFSTFQQEKVDAYEVGLKSSFARPVKGILNIAGFYNDFSNQQLQLGLTAKPGTSVAPASSILNVGKSRIWGAEVEASVTPFTGFTLEASYAYLNTKLQQVTPVTTPADIPYLVLENMRPGEPLPLSPRDQVTVTGTYVLPLDESIGQVSLGATFTHVDKQLTNYIDNNATRFPGFDAATVASFAALSYVPARNLLNLNLNWTSVAGLPIDASVFATNVTNRKYYTFIPGLLPQVTGFEVASVGEPRMFGARLRYRFGR